MVIKKPKVVIIGAGMAGLTAANKLYTCAASKDLIELCVVEGGSRIGGRINTSEFGGDRIEMGATWIHGIGGSPIHRIAQETNSLQSEQPWECMDGFLENPTTIAECGFKLKASLVDSISALFNKLMDFAQGKLRAEGESSQEQEYCRIASEVFDKNGEIKQLSVGSFLRRGLEAYWESVKDHDEFKAYGDWSKKLLEEAIFAMHENIQRTYTSAGDLFTLDYNAESEYQMFPGEEITIAKGYISVIESLASVLPPGLVQLGRQVTRIEWKQDPYQLSELENGHGDRPVRIHFSDGVIISADHVIVTVSLGVLKAAIQEKSGMFNPPLPSFKTGAISRLGYGVVNKLFLQLSPNHRQINDKLMKFPLLQMLFHRQDSELKQEKIPWWMRRTNSICPIYQNSSVLLSWFAGEEALELEKLGDEEIVNGVSTTISSFLHERKNSRPQESCNGSMKSMEISNERDLKIKKMLKTKWGSDPLFLGSYSYVAVGSSGDDLDIMAEPLPKISNSCPLLQILFAGEATHRTHYSTTHGAYFSGLREANRLLQHYQYL